MISVFAFLISLSRMCSLLIYVLNLILILILILILNMSSSMLKKKAASISQLATLNRFNVLQVHLVRVFLEQVLPHAKKNLASRNKPDCVIWLDMHVFHRILEQGCQQPVACAYAFFLVLVGAEDDGATFNMRMTFSWMSSRTLDMLSMSMLSLQTSALSLSSCTFADVQPLSCSTSFSMMKSVGTMLSTVNSSPGVTKGDFTSSKSAYLAIVSGLTSALLALSTLDVSRMLSTAVFGSSMLSSFFYLLSTNQDGKLVQRSRDIVYFFLSWKLPFSTTDITFQFFLAPPTSSIGNQKSMLPTTGNVPEPTTVIVQEQCMSQSSSETTAPFWS